MYPAIGLVTGGHKALPYGHARKFVVGAGFIPARNRVRCVPGPYKPIFLKLYCLEAIMKYK